MGRPFDFLGGEGTLFKSARGGEGWGIPIYIDYKLWACLYRCKGYGFTAFLSRGGGGVFGSSFAGYVPLASQNPHPFIVYSVANNCKPHLSHFWANVIVISRMEFNVSRLLNIKTTAGTIFQL